LTHNRLLNKFDCFYSFLSAMFNKLENLEDLFEGKRQGLYDAEKQLIKALPPLAAKVPCPRLHINIRKAPAHSRKPGSAPEAGRCQ
jgi:hypothetical protein